MKLKKWFTLVEMLVYIVSIWMIWILSVFLMSDIIKKIDIKTKRDIFFINYNNFVKDVLEKNEKWWKLYNPVSTWIILENAWKYIWYACKSTGIYQTYISFSTWSINWNTKEKYYSWFNCNQLTWKVNVYSWYWIKVDILDNKTYKYFLKN